jgi:hypothetical protein
MFRSDPLAPVIRAEGPPWRREGQGEGWFRRRKRSSTFPSASLGAGSRSASGAWSYFLPWYSGGGQRWGHRAQPAAPDRLFSFQRTSLFSILDYRFWIPFTHQSLRLISSPARLFITESNPKSKIPNRTLPMKPNATECNLPLSPPLHFLPSEQPRFPSVIIANLSGKLRTFAQFDPGVWEKMMRAENPGRLLPMIRINR